MITGATSGIGRWIARGLAHAGHDIVLIVRDAERGRAAQDFVRAGGSAAVELVFADLSSLASTRAAASTIARRHPRLSVLVNNAGVFRARRQRTAEGHELVLAVNHLAPFVLMRALRPALAAGAPSRIVTVGSSTSDRARIDPVDLELERGWGMVRAYSRSKLAVMMATFEMARRAAGTGVTANVVHPGAVATQLVRSPGVIGLAWQAMAPFLRSAEQGADTPLHVALAPELAAETGRYFKDRRAVMPNHRALDTELVAAVWEATDRLVAS